MTKIDIDLKKHCIETAIKQSYNRLLSQYFRTKQGDSELEAKLDLLANALSRLDFASLRATHQELAGKRSARIVLTDNGGDPPGIRINGRPIDMAPHIKK